ncbi:MAG: hypothetical protein HQL31_07280, partial [Planctomycetes bacterium]|nr:hypothetical protein [Planctomycetota bacterium]
EWLTALGNTFHLGEFWSRSYLGLAGPGFVAEGLPAHGSLLLRCTTASSDGSPLLVGSTLHIGMGRAEVSRLVSSPDGITLDLADAGARDGELHILSYRPLELTRVEGVEDARLEKCNGIWVLHLRGRRQGTQQICCTCV